MSLRWRRSSAQPNKAMERAGCAGRSLPGRWAATGVVPKLLISVAVVGLVACSEAAPPAVGNWTAPRVVFSPEQVAKQSDWTRRFGDIPAPPYWEPSEAAIVRAENTLWGNLDEFHRGCVRQVFGIIKSDQRAVRIQGFCCQHMYPDNPWWERTIVDLLDRGTCAFAADFDEQTGALLWMDWATPGPP